MVEQKKVPSIRFKGFADDWEQHELSKLATMHARIGWQNLRTSEFLDDGDYMLITGTDFEDGEINFSTCHYVEKERYDQDKNIQISDGSILITKDGTLGKVAYVQGLTKPATLNAGVFNVVIKKEDKTDEKYLFQYLKAPFLMDYVDKKATGGTIKHLNQKILVDFPVVLPKKEEQERIGKYLRYIDDLIILNQQKHDKLLNIKMAMLEKMFPRKGKNIPEIRYKGFTDNWERRKLSDITSKIGSGKTPLGGSKSYVDSGIPFIRSQNVFDDAVDLSEVVYIDDATNKSMDNSVVENNDVLLNITGASIGRSAVYKGMEQANVNQHVCIVRPLQKYSSDFIQINLSSKNGQKQIDCSQAGGAREGLNFQQIGKFEFLFPSFKEQNKLGAFFCFLSNLITLQQSKIRMLKSIKKSMMEKMFV